MKEDLMRRISAALDSADGLAGDPALQEELRADPANAKYAKDLTRIGKWLGTWPLPEPDDAAFEGLAARIEQRLDEPLGAIADPTAPPAFDDDDAIRDATVGLLQSGEYRVSDSAIEILSDSALVLPDAAAAAAPPSETSVPSPIAKVTLGKARVPAIVEESSGTGEPLSAAELELRLKSDPGAPKKKKKKKKPAGTASAESDRISIPTPKPLLSAPTLSPVVQLPKAEEKKPVSVFWWFAAAAAIGLGVFGSATLYESERTPVASAPHGSTLVTTGTLAPTAAAAPVAVVAPTVPAMPPATVVAAMPSADREQDLLAVAEPEAPERSRLRTAPPATAAPYAPARVAAGGGATTAHSTAAPVAPTPSGGDDALGRQAGTRRTAGPTDPTPAEGAAPVARAPVATPTPTTTATTPAPTPPPPADTGELPDSPDRSTIQAVLAARLAAVSACTNGAHGLADVDIVISGSGRITTATVNGTFAGTPIGSCIARAVRGATFPPFSQPRFEVTYPYHL